MNIDKTKGITLQRQVYASIRQSVLTGRLAAGARIPTSRALADELGISRTTVVLAYDQLTAEGFITSRGSAGSFVAAVHVTRQRHSSPTAPPAEQRVRASPAARRMVQVAIRANGLPHVRSASVPFRIGEPAYDLFPVQTWNRLCARIARAAGTALLGYGHPAGYMPLRRAIAAYVGAARGVTATAAQVILTRGTQQAIDFATRLLIRPGDSAWVGDPGYLNARAILHSAGAKLVPIAIDEHGLRVEDGMRRAPRARVAYVSPSHQFPLGTRMSLPRRLALLEWASANGSWVLEDDFDSEFRYSHEPIASLQGLDERQRVIYMGTFSKTMFPALRLGYLIVPPSLIELFLTARTTFDHLAPNIEQAALAAFMQSGAYTRHIRRMRVEYGARQKALTAAIDRELGDELEVTPSDTGMHLVAWLRDTSLDDAAIAGQARAAGVEVGPMSLYALRASLRPGLLLGFAATRPGEFRSGLRVLRKAIEAARRGG